MATRTALHHRCSGRNVAVGIASPRFVVARPFLPSAHPIRPSRRCASSTGGEASAAPLEAPTPQTTLTEKPEETFYEGPVSSNAELAVSVLLGVTTLLYLPLTMASIGRRFWINVKVTNKRLIVRNTSPLFKREIGFDKIKEVRSAPRAFGSWGDIVFILKDGKQLDIVGVEKFREIKEHVERCIYTL